MKHVSCTLAASLLLAAAATALGQAPAINGVKDASYGPALWVNTANPTGYGDNTPGNFPCSDFGSGMQLAIDNSNRAGVTGDACTGTAPGGDLVTTGIEFMIPFSAINNPTEATFRLGGFINGQSHDFLSNQVIGLSECAANLGEPRAVDFGTINGDQFVTVTNGSDTAAAGPTIDGQLDAAFYGAPLWVNTIETGFGDSTDPPANNLAGGSEFGALYARVVSVGGEKALYVFVSGNLQTNFNKFDFFIDTVAGAGQNRILGNNNTNIDFNAINRLGENPIGSGNGLKFDTGFDPDYFLTCTNGGTPVTTYANFAELPTAGNGAGRYVGSAVEPLPIIVTPCVPTPLPVPSPDKAYGSEFDAVYGIVCDNYLYLFIAGNLEVNGNRVDLFFDVDNTTMNAGQQTLRSDNIAADFGGLNRMGGPENEGPGLTFDAGFAADYWVTFQTNGYGVADPVDQASVASFLRSTGAAGDVTSAQGLLDYASFTRADKTAQNPLSYDGTFCVRTDTMNACAPNGAGTAWNPTSIPGIDVQGDLFVTINNLPTIAEPYSSFAPRLISANPFDPLGTQAPNPNLTFPGLIQLSIDNSNVAGVTAEAATGGDAVNTGYEVRIRIDELGWDGVSPIRVCGFISGADHSSLSNQVLGGLPAGTANLGEARAVDFNTFAGEQFVTIPVGDCAGAQTGACCSGSTCMVTTQIACAGSFTHYAGNGTVCNLPGNNTSPCCLADYNQSGSVTVQDIFDFLGGYFTQNTQADINASGSVTVQDIFDFLAAYFTGC